MPSNMQIPTSQIADSDRTEGRPDPAPDFMNAETP